MKLCSLLILLSFVLSSCGYFTRKNCEKINWFDYGKKMALQGKRLDGDKKILNCQQAEAHVDHQNLDLGFKEGYSNYCQPSMAKEKGRSGQIYNFDFCQPSETVKKQMQLAHREGVREYCAPSNAYTLGKSGVVVPKLCPQETLKAFLPEYKKGRKIYLKGQVQSLYDSIDGKKRLINNSREEVISLESKLASIRSQKNAYLMAGVVAGTTESSSTQTALQSLVSDEERLIYRKKREREKILSYERDIQSLQKKIRVFEAEMIDL